MFALLLLLLGLLNLAFSAPVAEPVVTHPKSWPIYTSAPTSTYHIHPIYTGGLHEDSVSPTTVVKVRDPVYTSLTRQSQRPTHPGFYP
jgi:hypothetical protein